MKIKSGRVFLTKKDAEAIALFLEHARRDMAYRGDGTYSKAGSLENELDERALKKGEHGLACIETLLEQVCEGY